MTYSDGIAPFCDLFGPAPGQAEQQASFVARFVDPGTAILDIGAGVGNTAISLAAAGHAVTALEPDPGMYGVLLARIALRPDLEASLTPVPGGVGCALDRRFDAVLCLAVLHHLAEAEQALLWRYVHAHLREGGVFVLDAAVEGSARQESTRRLVAERRFGTTLFQHFTTLQRLPGGRWCTLWEFVTRAGERVLEQRQQRFEWQPSSRAEIVARAKAEGFAVQACFSEPDGTPFRDGESRALLLVARRLQLQSAPSGPATGP